MALINGIIPTSKFELIRDRIGQILVTEFVNQAALTGDSDLNVSVYSERFIPIDKTEPPLINVCFASGTYDNKNIKSVDGNYIYNIDFYTVAKTTNEQSGDTAATKKLHRLMAIARAIIENPRYRTLGYDAPFNCNIAVSSIMVSDPVGVDSTHKVQGRLTVSVRVPETVELLTAQTIGNNTTRVLIDDTSKGLRYVWSTNFALPIGAETSSFTLPREYSGLTVVLINDGNQSYETGFTQSGDVITMTNGAVFVGQNLEITGRLNDYTAEITVAAAGSSFTLPAAYAGKTIGLVFDGTQAYAADYFTQNGITITMLGNVTLYAGQKITIWYGVQLVAITAEAGNTYSLPEDFEGFEQAMLFDGTQGHTGDSFSQDGLNITMTNTTVFTEGQKLISVLR